MNLSQVEKTSTAPGAAGTATAQTKSVTYYSGTVNDEKSDYTIKYSAGTVVDYTSTSTALTSGHRMPG